MDKLLEKVSSYNIFNYLLPGVLFASLGSRFTSFSFLLDDLFEGIFVYYLYGLAISRIGSLFLGPFLKWLGFIEYFPYPDYLEASKFDSKIELFSEINNMYRTMASLFFCLLLLKTFDYVKKQGLDISNLVLWAVVFFLCVIFVLSYRKQTGFIKKRIEKANKENKESGVVDEILNT